MSGAPIGNERVRPTETGSERETLTQMLDFLRATVVIKASGLTHDQAVARVAPWSELSVASIVKHLCGVERFWFSIDYAGLDLPWPWPEDDPHGNFLITDDDAIESIIPEYVTECERSRRAIGDDRLDAIARSDDMDFSLRYALTHMIEETARHCGHLDLLREGIDGASGQ